MQHIHEQIDQVGTFFLKTAKLLGIQANVFEDYNKSYCNHNEC